MKFVVRHIFRCSIRSTAEFYDNNPVTPSKKITEDRPYCLKTQSSCIGTKKCFILSAGGTNSNIVLQNLVSRLPLPGRLSFNLTFFECTDFTHMPRNCHSVTCIIRYPHSQVFRLASIVLLPPCGTYLYVFEWNGSVRNDLPDFVFWNDYTNAESIHNSFTFKKLRITKETDITFVQLVLGPWTDLCFHCHFNHFDGALELLPDGPSKIVPEGMWSSLPVFHSIANARSMHKIERNNKIDHRKLRRMQMLSELPACTDIFQSFRKRYRNKLMDTFMNGKIISDDLSIMHVQLQIPMSMRMQGNDQRLFAIPFLGDMSGKFGNVTMSVMKKLDIFFQMV